LKGRVTSVDLSRRYGWILGNDEQHYRFWARSCHGQFFEELSKGISVEFTPAGSRAFDVRLLRPILPVNGEPRQGFVRKLGDGFAILGADDGKTYMAGRSDVGSQVFGQLRLGGGVRFETQRSERGLRARAVVALDC
jgi:cold shock CspA family protein